jgi:O-antigen/teichoic acid export membrane protein
LIARRSIAELLGLACSFAATVLLTRALGPSTFGYYAAVVVIVQLGTIVAGLGLSQTGGVLVAREHRQVGSVVPLVCLPRLAVGGLLFVGTIVVCGVGLLDAELSGILVVAAISWLIAAFRLEWLFVARGDLAFVSVLRVVTGLAFVGSATLAATTHDTAAIGFTILGPIAMAAVIANVRLAIEEGGLRWRIPPASEMRAALASGTHFMRGELATLVTMSSDRLFLLVLTTPAVLGLYDAAYRIILPFYSVAAIVNDTSYAELARSPTERTLQSYSLRTLALTLPVGFVLTMTAGSIVTFLYGTPFAQSANYLVVLGWVITVGFLSGVVVYPLTAWGRPREYGNAVTTGGITCLIANVLLIPTLAGIGAALATLAGKAASALVGYRAFTRATSYWIGGDMLRVMAASGLASFPAAVCLLVLGNSSWIVAIVVFGVAYVGAGLFLFGYRGLRAAFVTDGGRAKSSSMF